MEDAFRAKLSMFAADQATAPGIPSRQKQRKRKAQSRSDAVDKSVLALPEPLPAARSKSRQVSRQATLFDLRPAACRSSSPAFAQSRALSRKVSDEFTVPLCRGHHREVHRAGDEATWWDQTGIDPLITARTLSLEPPLGSSNGTDHRSATHARGKSAPRRIELHSASIIPTPSSMRNAPRHAM